MVSLNSLLRMYISRPQIRDHHLEKNIEWRIEPTHRTEAWHPTWWILWSVLSFWLLCSKLVASWRQSLKLIKSRSSSWFASLRACGSIWRNMLQWCCHSINFLLSYAAALLWNASKRIESLQVWKRPGERCWAAGSPKVECKSWYCTADILYGTAIRMLSLEASILIGFSESTDLV